MVWHRAYIVNVPTILSYRSSICIGIEAGWMDDDVVDSGGSAWKHTTRTIMVIVPMLMLIWITCYGYKLTTMRFTETNSYEDSFIALLFGVVTVIFGLIYFIYGVVIVAGMTMDLSAWLQQDDTGISGNQEKEQMTNYQICVHTIAVMVSMFMLTGAIYYGYKLAVEARVVVIVDRLAFLIGVISMAFGFIYFIIGMGIVAQSALQSTGAKSDALLDRQSEVKLTSVLCDP